jgi:hypothetical protein
MSYEDKVSKLKKIQFILIIICVIAFLAYVFFITRPEITAHVVRDECGPIGGTISHSIDDVDTCENACNAYCSSIGQNFHSVEFYMQGAECNTCDCFCKGERFK